MNIDRQKIIEWSKENPYFLIYERNIDSLKNALPNTIMPDNIWFNTAQFANFFGELIEKFKIACAELECVDDLERKLKIAKDALETITPFTMYIASNALKQIRGDK